MAEPFDLKTVRKFTEKSSGSACLWKDPQEGLCLGLGDPSDPARFRIWALGDPIPASTLRYKVPWPFVQASWSTKPISKFRGKVSIATALLRMGVVTPEEAMETFTLAVLLGKEPGVGVLGHGERATAPEGLEVLWRRLAATDPLSVPEGSGGKPVATLAATVYDDDHPFPHAWLNHFIPRWLERHADALEAHHREFARGKGESFFTWGLGFWWEYSSDTSLFLRNAEAARDPAKADAFRREALSRVRFAARVLACPERFPVLLKLFMAKWTGAGAMPGVKAVYAEGFARLGLPSDDPVQTGLHYRAILGVKPAEDPDDSGPEPFL